MKQPNQVQQLGKALIEASDKQSALIQTAIKVAETVLSEKQYIEKLEAALKPFANWYQIQLGRRGPEFATDDYSLCICTKRADNDPIGTPQLRKAFEVLDNRRSEQEGT